MQQIKLVTKGLGGMWLLVGLLMACSIAGVTCLASLAVMETPVNGMLGPIGFSSDWIRRLPAGQRLSVAWDRAMPRGYERIYLYQGGEIIGSLPESPVAIKVRKALSHRRPVQVTVVKLDPQDPAYGIRVRVAFEAAVQQHRSPIAVQALNGGYSLM